MSAISHKVNTENYLVNDYLRGFADSRTSPGSCIVIYAFYLFKPEPLLELTRQSWTAIHITKTVTRLKSNMLNNSFLPPNPNSNPNPPIDAAKILR